MNLLVFSSVIQWGGILGLIAVLVPVLSLFYVRNGSLKVYMPGPGRSVLVMYFVLQLSIWSIARLLGLNPSLHQYVIQALIMFCFLLILLATRQNILEDFIRAYVIFASVMGLAGFLAWCLIYSGHVDSHNFLLNFHDISNGRIPEGESTFYSWPYYLGLIVTNVNPDLNRIGSIVFYRACGWAREPAMAALFVMPALIILVLDKYIFKKSLRFVLASIIFSFWVVCGAVSSFISIFLLIIFGLVLFSFKRSASERLIFIIAILLCMGFMGFSFRNNIIHMSSFIQSKLSADAPTFKSTFSSIFWFLYPQRILNILIHSLALLSAVFIFKVAMRGVLRGGPACVYGYVMLYLVFHNVKTGWIKFSTDPFTMFFFYLLVFYSYNYALCDNEGK